MKIRVTLINPAQRRFFQAQWDDPITGKTKTISTKTTIRREAERFAGRLEESLNEGTFKRLDLITWTDFRERYTSEVSNGKSEKTKLKTQSMWNAVEEYYNPSHLRVVANPNFISQYAAKLRDNGREPFTVKGHLAEIRKVLRWAKKMGMIKEIPGIEFPETIDGMKGRPINDAEFDKLIKAVPKVVLPEFVQSWEQFIVAT